MKPHLRLHFTKKGEWWVSQSSPTDRGHTINSTLNFRSSTGAVTAARWLRSHWPSIPVDVPGVVRQQYVRYSEGWSL